MSTTLEIDDELMNALLARHPRMSTRDAVETAVRSYLAREAAKEIRALRGRIDIEDMSAERRTR
jgi:hypothetical protein